MEQSESRLSFYLSPTGSLKDDLTRGMTWLAMTAPKYPGQDPLLAVNDVRFFDGWLQPIIGQSWDQVRLAGSRISIGGVTTVVATERTINDPWHHVVLAVNPTDMLFEKIEGHVRYLRELLVVTDSIKRHQGWFDKLDAHELQV